MNFIRKSVYSTTLSRVTAPAIVAWLFAIKLHATATGNLPWERPMTAIATSLTGPVAYAVGLIGIAIAGGTMLWGGELTEFGRRACRSVSSYPFWFLPLRSYRARSASALRWSKQWKSKGCAKS
ncbi:MAG TPA: TrbC/VirB2 family protein [Bryobacteraceae bacterium]|jgi:type IV secretion system protein VirB2|nr:TrbC/VirB2 family protein [Bryobacteraceae bacterium]